ncbi:MAG: hypothetical protein WKG07_00315 [Hymenobacter sp.]
MANYTFTPVLSQDNGRTRLSYAADANTNKYVGYDLALSNGTLYQGYAPGDAAALQSKALRGLRPAGPGPGPQPAKPGPPLAPRPGALRGRPVHPVPPGPGPAQLRARIARYSGPPAPAGAEARGCQPAQALGLFAAEY